MNPDSNLSGTGILPVSYHNPQPNNLGLWPRYANNPQPDNLQPSTK
ncbi:hypothetical protein [Moorena sp. SIO4E2]|nr:hypothetical protein [Moorena sp. SIO4E2]